MDAVTVHLTYLGVPFLTYAGENNHFISLRAQRYTEVHKVHLVATVLRTLAVADALGKNPVRRLCQLLRIRLRDPNDPAQTTFKPGDTSHADPAHPNTSQVSQMMTPLNRSNRPARPAMTSSRAEDISLKELMMTTTTTAQALEPFNLPLLNAFNVAEFRAHHGVRTHQDLHQAIATRDVLATAHDALLAPPFDPGDFRDARDVLAMAIEILDAVSTPTEEALSDFFIENWVFEVVDGECRVRYSPLTAEDWRESMMEEEAS